MGEKSARDDKIDVARGVAFVLMLVHHIAFFADLSNTAGLDDPSSAGGVGPVASACGWVARHAFILIAGFALGTQIRGQSGPSENEQREGKSAWIVLRRRLVRCVEIGAHAALVSLVTYLAIPGAWVRFGVLHFLCVGLGVTAVMLSVPRFVGAVLGIGLLWLLFRQATGVPWLDTATGARPVGAMVDWFPLRRWLPLLWLGVAVGWIGWSSSPKEAEDANEANQTKSGESGFGVGLLRFVGRHSLVLYTAHYVALCALVALVASHRAEPSGAE